MRKTKQFFYSAWAFAWFVLGISTSILFCSLRSDSSETLFDLEAWFITFPVAWTIAFLMVRHKGFWDAVVDGTTVKFFISVACCGMLAWGKWDSEVRHHDVAEKTFAIVFFICAALGFLAIVADALPKIKAQLGKSNQP